ncbi:MAG: NAD-dependent epimerase/dehydratase family protein [Sphingobacterium sp.]
MKKKIFITGASGFVGSHLVEAAHDRGFEVHAAVRKTSNTHDIAPFVSKFLYPNLSSSEELKTIFESQQYTYILHAAAMTKAKDVAAMKKVNVGYTEALLRAATESNVPPKRIVYVSSLAALGPTFYENDVLIDENFPYCPLTVYGRSKMESEIMIREQFSDAPISVFRPTAVYGPRERDLFMLFDTMNRGLDPYIGRKPQKLSFIYVKDLVDVLLAGLTADQDRLQFYNISDGEIYSRYAMAAIFKGVLNKRLWRMHVPHALVKGVARLSQVFYRNSRKIPVIYPERLRELTAENWACDISKARQDLGFGPKYGLESGLRESLRWYRENRWLK